MESKNESIQLTRICITTTFPVGEKSFFSKSALEKISISIVLVLCTRMKSAKLQKSIKMQHDSGAGALAKVSEI